jgi:AcrR family transcriptional regulator
MAAPAQRGTRTRTALLEAARTVFERDGYAGARITDIADAAGVAHGSFYTHFKGKDDVFAAVVRDVREELHDVPEHPDDPVAALAATNRAYLDGVARNARLLAVVDQVATLDPLARADRLRRAREMAERYGRVIRRLQADGRADPELDPDTAALALTTMVSRTALLAFTGGLDVDRDLLLDTVNRLWANALRLEGTP